MSHKRYVIMYGDFNRKYVDFEIDTKTGCWNCVSHYVPDDKYPQIQREYRRWNIHRYIWYKYVDSDIEGYDIHHTCENKRCINPDHLEKLSPESHAKKHKQERIRAARAGGLVGGKRRKGKKNGVIIRYRDTSYE